MFNARNRIDVLDGTLSLLTGTQSLDFIGSPESRVRTLRTGGFGNVILNGTYYISQTLFGYFGSHDFANGSRTWGGEQQGGVFETFMGIDEYFFATSAPDASRRVLDFSKFRHDSTLVWNIRSSHNVEGFRRGVLDINFLGNDTAIIVGIIDDIFFNRFWYIAKISGMGRPFDPTGQKYPHLVKHDALPYPNPTASRFSFKKTFGKGEIHLFNLNGRCLLSKNITPGTEIDISHLPSGKYLYRAILDDEPHVGSVVKE